MSAFQQLSARAHDHSMRGAPRGAQILNCILPLLGITTLSMLIARRTKNFPGWKNVPLARWLVLAVYFDSYIFIFASTFLQTSIGLDSGPRPCDSAIILCIACYLSSKVIIYSFLVEKVYIIRSKHKCPRRKDKLYLFNTCGMLIPFGVVLVLTLVYRVGELDKDGHCFIGLKLEGNLPLLILDVSANIYLTSLFLSPLVGLYKFEQANIRLRSIAKRTFWGSCATLFSSVVNLTTIIIMKGHEPGWLCLICCNADVIFSACVLHWVTSSDFEAANGSGSGGNGPSSCTHCRNSRYSMRTRPTSHATKNFSVLRSQNQSEFIGPGARSEVITDCIGGKHDERNGVVSYHQMGKITVRIDHKTEIEDLETGRRSDTVAESEDRDIANSSMENINDTKIRKHHESL